MPHRRPHSAILASLPIAAMLLGTSTLAAQTPPSAPAAVGAIRAAPAAPANRISLSVEQVRALMIAHHRDVAAGTSEDNTVTFILASNGDYVASGSSKAVAAGGFARGAGGGGVGGVVAAGGAPAGVVTARGSAPAGQAVAVLAPTRAADAANEPRMMTILGVGEVDARLVQDMYFKSYEPGEVSMNAIRVRFVTLTGNVVK